jgi:hypothetical protein
MPGLITTRELARMHASPQAGKHASTPALGMVLLLAVAALAAWVAWVVLVRPVVVPHAETVPQVNPSCPVQSPGEI